jgi:hypothetical protein
MAGSPIADALWCGRCFRSYNGRVRLTPNSRLPVSVGPDGKGGATQPCVLARFTHAFTRAPLGIHRRPIALAGAKPKSLGPVAGGVVRLWPDDSVATGLVLGEGLAVIMRPLAAAPRLRPVTASRKGRSAPNPGKIIST